MTEERMAETAELIETRYKNSVISISNSLIRSRDYTNLLESKIEVLAIYHMDRNMKRREKVDADGNPYSVNYVELTAKEIKGLMGRTDGKSYTDIERVSIRMAEKLYIIEDRENHKFSIHHMYNSISYDNGKLFVEFEPGMEKHFMNLKSNFTRLNLELLFSFRKNGGFQLYKILKSYAFAPHLEPIDMSLSQEELPSFTTEWSLVDLRMMMGYVDITQSKLKAEGSKSHPDWDKMASEESKPQYARWTDFKKRVINPGVEEINRISDIYIAEVESQTSGRGGKTTAITFRIQHNKAYYEKHGAPASSMIEDKKSTIVLSESDLDEFIDEMRSFIKRDDIKTRDLKAIAEASGYDMDLIRSQYDISKTVDINNFTGWMIKAVEVGYSMPQHVSKQSTRVHNAMERDYDFDRLEEQIQRKQRGESYDFSGMERQSMANPSAAAM